MHRLTAIFSLFCYVLGASVFGLGVVELCAHADGAEHRVVSVAKVVADDCCHEDACATSADDCLDCFDFELETLASAPSLPVKALVSTIWIQRAAVFERVSLLAEQQASPELAAPKVFAVTRLCGTVQQLV